MTNHLFSTHMCFLAPGKKSGTHLEPWTGSVVSKVSMDFVAPQKKNVFFFLLTLPSLTQLAFGHQRKKWIKRSSPIRKTLNSYIYIYMFFGTVPNIFLGVVSSQRFTIYQVVVSKIFYFQSSPGRWSNLTSFFSDGLKLNHQPVEKVSLGFPTINPPTSRAEVGGWSWCCKGSSKRLGKSTNRDSRTFRRQRTAGWRKRAEFFSAEKNQRSTH